jgi:hypothetical protein
VSGRSEVGGRPNTSSVAVAGMPVGIACLNCRDKEQVKRGGWCGCGDDRAEA